MAWHNHTQQISGKEIQEQFLTNGILFLFDFFKEKIEGGGTLIFSLSDAKDNKESNKLGTFMFTHTAMRDYLVAKKLVFGILYLDRETRRNARDPNKGWTKQDGLRYWAQMCGPAPLNITILEFLRQEIRLKDKNVVQKWQETLCKLIESLLMDGVPMDQISPRLSYSEEIRQARNAEESLLAVLNATAQVTRKVSRIEWPDATSASVWLNHLHSQRIGHENGIALESLSFMDFSDCIFFMKDLYRANLHGSKFKRALMTWANLSEANLEGVCFEGARLEEAYLSGANIRKANFKKAHLEEAHFKKAQLEKACLCEASLEGSHQREVQMKMANLKNANLSRAHFRRANFKGANLAGANLKDARFIGADFTDANLRGANLDGANLTGAIFLGANLEGISHLLPAETIVELLSKVKTLYKAKFDRISRKLLTVNHPELFKKVNLH